MGYDAVVDKAKLNNKLTSIANKIRNRSTKKTKYNFYSNDYEDAIDLIPTGEENMIGAILIPAEYSLNTEGNLVVKVNQQYKNQKYMLVFQAKNLTSIQDAGVAFICCSGKFSISIGDAPSGLFNLKRDNGLQGSGLKGSSLKYPEYGFVIEAGDVYNAHFETLNNYSIKLFLKIN